MDSTVRNLGLYSANFTHKEPISPKETKSQKRNIVENGNKKSTKALKWLALIAMAGICTGAIIYNSKKGAQIDIDKLKEAGKNVKGIAETSAPIATTLAGTAIALNQIADARTKERAIVEGEDNEPKEEKLSSKELIEQRIENFSEYNTYRINTEELDFFKEQVAKLNPEIIEIMPDNQLASLLYIMNDNQLGLRLRKMKQLETDFTMPELKKMFKYYTDGDFRAWLASDSDVIGCQRFEEKIKSERYEDPEAKKIKEEKKAAFERHAKRAVFENSARPTTPKSTVKVQTSETQGSQEEEQKSRSAAKEISTSLDNVIDGEVDESGKKKYVVHTEFRPMDIFSKKKNKNCAETLIDRLQAAFIKKSNENFGRYL